MKLRNSFTKVAVVVVTEGAASQGDRMGPCDCDCDCGHFAVFGRSLQVVSIERTGEGLQEGRLAAAGGPEDKGHGPGGEVQIPGRCRHAVPGGPKIRRW